MFMFPSKHLLGFCDKELTDNCDCIMITRDKIRRQSPVLALRLPYHMCEVGLVMYTYLCAIKACGDCFWAEMLSIIMLDLLPVGIVFLTPDF